MPKIYDYPCESNYECEPIQIDLLPGRYFIECYGAEGGRGLSNAALDGYGGKGAYASGLMILKQKTTFYLYIGGKGQDGIPLNNVNALGGWNGGGNSGQDTAAPGDLADTSGGGGGSTDIRLVKEIEGDDSTSIQTLDTRIIVAAGGSGCAGSAYGAPGGDLNGYITTANGDDPYSPVDVSQNQKGRGEDGQDDTYTPSSGSGSGYHGGSKGVPHRTHHEAVSSSGSSYVAGHASCPDLPGGYGNSFDRVLLYPHIRNGFSNFPPLNYETTKQYEVGHQGNGAVKITKLDICTFFSQRRYDGILFVSITIAVHSL